MNYQSWEGFTDARFGYGAMLSGFVDHVPDGVVLNRKASVHVHMGVPFSVKQWFEGQTRVLFTMWETDELPTSFLRYLPLFDRVVVPCQHNVKLFAKHHRDVVFVPLGVDADVWKPRPSNRSGPFRFTAGGSLWRRKGLDVVVRAFNELGLPNTELHIKAAPHARDVPQQPLGDRVFLHRQWMSLEDQIRWFHDSDCFVAPARGEGFGLIPLQNIALGVPTIVSDTSGQHQFSHLATHVVSTRKVAAETVGKWDEPNLSELKRAMLDVFENRWERRAEATRRSPLVDEFSWVRAAEKLVGVLPAGKLLGAARKVVPFVEVQVRAKRAVDATIGEQRVRLVAGQVATISDGQYQVLFDAGAVELVR